MNNIIINGRSVSVSGKNISINNSTIMVDGVVIEGGLSGIVEVKFEGDLASLKCNGSATIHGNVIGNVVAGGSIKCFDVGNNVDAGGSVQCADIRGDIDAGGSVKYTGRMK